MKVKKLFIFIPVFALAACGTSAQTLTPEQAQERANQILASQETVEEPTSYTMKVSNYLNLASSEDTIMETQTEKTIVIADLFYSYSFEGSMKTGGEQADIDFELHTYVKDGEFFMAIAMTQNGESFKQYSKTSIPEGEEITTDDVLLAGIYGAASAMGDEEPETSDYNVSLETAFSMNVILEGIINLFITDEEVLSLGLDNYEFTAKSKGEGHLITQTSYKATITEGDLSSTLIGEQKVVWENNLLVEDHMKDVITETDGTNSAEMTVEAKTQIAYSAKPSYPNLSSYTYIEAA